MFYHIEGVLEHIGSNFAVLSAGGIGYKVYTSFQTLQKLPPKGERAKLFTHLYVREDIFDLYGFVSNEELSIFELLISVSGVGPKAALSLLSAVSPTDFAKAVVTNTTAIITKAQGIGPKLASRIILELKDKLKSQITTENVGNDTTFTAANEAVSALMVLGYSHFEAERAVIEAATKSEGLEDTIKTALKLLMK